MKPQDTYAALWLERARLRYEQGDKLQLLYSLDWCLTNNFEPPPSVKEGLRNAMNAAWLYQIKSWDEVFGELLPKGTRIAMERRNQRISMSLFWRVRELHDDAGAAIDEGLFEKVGKEFGWVRR